MKLIVDGRDVRIKVCSWADVEEKDVIGKENFGIREAMSLMERMKRSVPKIDPWGTPERMG